MQGEELAKTKKNTQDLRGSVITYSMGLFESGYIKETSQSTSSITHNWIYTNTRTPFSVDPLLQLNSDDQAELQG